MRRASTIATLLVAVSVAGCASGPSGPVTAVNNPSLYSVHQPVVEQNHFVLELDASGDTLGADERARLAGWFDTIELRYGDRLYVEEPRDYPSPRARAGVAGLVAEYGMMLQDGVGPVVVGTAGPGRIRVIASRATASVPGCPNWSEEQILPTVRTSSNYGCATNSNLAAMVADPNDLVLGEQGNGRSAAQTAGRAVRVYRERAMTGGAPLQAPSTRSGGN